MRSILVASILFALIVTPHVLLALAWLRSTSSKSA